MSFLVQQRMTSFFMRILGIIEVIKLWRWSVLKKYGIFLGLVLLGLMIMWLPFLPMTSKENVLVKDYTRLVFKSSWGGVDAKSDILTALIAEFNKDNPDILVVDASLAGQDFLYSLKTDFAVNEPPDVFGLWPGSDLDTLIEQKKIADLRGLIKKSPEWRANFDEAIANVYLSEDAVYSIPFEVICEGLFINRDLFTKYSVPLPINESSFIYAVNVFKRKGVIPIALNMTPEGSFMIQNLTAAYGGVEIETDLEVLLMGLKSSLELQKKLYQLGAFPKDCLTLDDYSRNQLFLEGQAAMIFQGSWFYTEAFQTMNNMDVFYPPGSPKGEKNLVLGLGNGNFHMSEKAFIDPVKQEASWRFIKYLTSQKSASAFSEQPGFISSLEESDEQVPSDGLVRILTLIDNATSPIKPVDHLMNRQVWEEVFIAQLPLVMTGEMTVDEAMQNLLEALP
jgi:raffinose/stachyose/melibiose transport system substrate-binding protein